MPRSKFTQEAKNLLGQLEGEKLEAYQDQGGVWTIGRGHTKDVTPGMVISEAQSDQFFETDIGLACDSVDSVLGSRVDSLNPNQYSAFVLFAFNVKHWNCTPLCVLLRAGEIEKVKAHWLLYDKVEVNGVKVDDRGLAKRRQAELDLFTAPVS